jgi:hypothetical protein
VAALGEPATPRTFLYGTLTALIPVDDESRRIMLAYTAHYTLTLTQPELAPDGLAYANALQDLVAEQIRQAQNAGQISAEEDPGTAAAIVLALINGLQWSVLAGQRDGRSAVALAIRRRTGPHRPNRMAVSVNRPLYGDSASGREGRRRSRPRKRTTTKPILAAAATHTIACPMAVITSFLPGGITIICMAAPIGTVNLASKPITPGRLTQAPTAPRGAPKMTLVTHQTSGSSSYQGKGPSLRMVSTTL